MDRLVAYQLLPMVLCLWRYQGLIDVSRRGAPSAFVVLSFRLMLVMRTVHSDCLSLGNSVRAWAWEPLYTKRPGQILMSKQSLWRAIFLMLSLKDILRNEDSVPIQKEMDLVARPTIVCST
jgi:hypothetical protein